jgi:alkylhydroperoxidase family enzyme
MTSTARSSWAEADDVSVEPTLRLLAQMRTAQLVRAAEELGRLMREAITLGETSTRLVHLDRWRDSLLFDKRERAALTIADALAGRVTGSAIRRAARQLDPHELVQLALACAATAAQARIEPTERNRT